jgi:hypothetical protein
LDVKGIEDFKFGVMGERGSGLRRPKPFLEERFWIPKNFINILINHCWLKFLKGVQRETSFKKFPFGVPP